MGCLFPVSSHDRPSVYVCVLIYSFFFLFFLFWLRWVFVAVRGLSLVAASGGYSSLQHAGFLLRCLLLLRSISSRRMGFSSFSMQVQELWHAGSVVVAHGL